MLAQRGVDVGLERRGRAAPVAGVGGDDQPGLGVVAAVDDGVGREAAEDHRVGHADAGAGQHGDGQLGHHRHVDGDAVARARGPDDFSTLANLHTSSMQVAVGERAGVARLALPVVRDPVAPARLDVAVEAVVGDVERAADEPLGEGQVPLERGVEVLEPADAARGPGGPRTPRSRVRPRRRAIGRSPAPWPANSGEGGNVRSSR